MIRIDLHSHSNVSQDGWMSPTELVQAAVAAGIDKVAITDHREIDGAIQARAQFPERVIVGEEIHCNDGTHLIGLFLSKLVPSGMPVVDTILAIRRQNGVVCAPHPFAYAWNAERRARHALAEADVVEVFNSRAFLNHWNRRAKEATSIRGLPAVANSDAHFPWEFGRAYTEIPAFTDVDSFRLALKKAHPVGVSLGSPWLHIGSRSISELRRFAPWLRREPIKMDVRP